MIGLYIVIIISLVIVIVALILNRPDQAQWDLREDSEAMKEMNTGLPCKDCRDNKICVNKACPLRKPFYCNRSVDKLGFCYVQCLHCKIVEGRSNV